MLLLASLFWNICLMREGPERVPAHPLLIGLIIIGKIVLVLLIDAARGIDTNLLELATAAITWATVIGLLVALALRLRERLPRFSQTFGAIVGTDLVMHCLYGGLILALYLLSIEPSADLKQTFNILFQLWIIFIVGFIMHRALNLNIGLGIAIAFFISVFSIAISLEVASST